MAEKLKPTYTPEQRDQLRAGFQLLRKFNIPQLLQEISQQNSQAQPEIISTITNQENSQATYELRVKHQETKRKGLIRLRSTSDSDRESTEIVGKIIFSSNGTNINFQCIDFYSSELANQTPININFNPIEVSPDEFQKTIESTLSRIESETEKKGKDNISQIASLRTSLDESLQKRPKPFQSPKHFSDIQLD